MHQLRLPCHTGILALLVEIDRVVGAWCPHEKTTIDKLRQLTGRGWRPQDCELLDTYSGLVEQWVLTATELLDKRPVVSLHVPCPRCGEKFAYHRDGTGERVRVHALRVSETGCRCLECQAYWPPERFGLLARLLGCDGVLSA